MTWVPERFAGVWHWHLCSGAGHGWDSDVWAEIGTSGLPSPRPVDGRSELPNGPVPHWVALTACGFMIPIGLVLFRGASSGTENKPRLRGFCQGRMQFWELLVRGKGPLAERRGAEGRKGVERGCITPFKALTKGHHHLVKMSPSLTSPAGPSAGMGEEVRACGSLDLVSCQAI